MKAIEQYLPVVLFMFYKVALTFASMDEILNCDHSMQYGAVYYAVQGSSNF